MMKCALGWGLRYEMCDREMVSEPVSGPGRLSVNVHQMCKYM